MKSHRTYYLIGLFVIIFLYSLNFQFYRSQFAKHLHPFLQKSIPYVFILMVYGVGILSFLRIPPPWVLSLWHIIHFFLFGVLIFSAIYHQLRVSNPPRGLINFQQALRETLVSPSLYIVMGLLRRYLSAFNKKQR